MKKFVDKALYGELDSDRHLVSIFAMALACKGKTYVELGVREGHTSEPIYEAAKLNEGHLWSVDLNPPSEYKPNNGNYTFTQKDSIRFLEEWDKDKKMDFVFVDDWHSYRHVKKQLELLDKLVGPSSIILLHDLMYGNTQPFYHADLSALGAEDRKFESCIPDQYKYVYV